MNTAVAQPQLLVDILRIRNQMEADTQAFETLTKKRLEEAQPFCEELYKLAPEEIRGMLKHWDVLNRFIKEGVVHEDAFKSDNMGRHDLNQHFMSLSESWKEYAIMEWEIPHHLSDQTRATFTLKRE